MPKTLTSAKVTRRERLAWYLYDFGNSAYAAIVLLAVFSAYFKGQVVGVREATDEELQHGHIHRPHSCSSCGSGCETDCESGCN